MLASQFRSTARAKGSSPYVFFYQLGDLLEIAVDEKTYGNDSRFCRRSNNFNAELRHVVDKGSLHLFIVTVRGVEKNQEILLPLDNLVDTPPSAPLPSISADVREIKRPSNGLLNTSTDDEPLALRGDVKERKKKERKKSKQGTSHGGHEEGGPSAARKTRAQVQKPSMTSPKIEVEMKTEIKIEVDEKPVTSVSPVKFEQQRPIKDEEESLSDNEKPLVNGLQSPKQRQQSQQQQPEHPETSANMTSPMKGHHKTSPSSGCTKLGLPDNKGLIVGVNTINYDASSSVRNKAKVCLFSRSSLKPAFVYLFKACLFQYFSIKVNSNRTENQRIISKTGSFKYTTKVSYSVTTQSKCFP